MAAAAQLARELASLNDAHGIAVFLAEQSRDARLASGVERSLVRAHGNGVHDLLVCDALNLGQLLGRYALEVGEVKAQAIGANVAASLLHMVAQNLAQRRMEQMRAGMVARNALAAKLVDNRANGVAHVKLAFDDFHVVAGETLLGSLGIDDFSLEAFAFDNAGVAHFAAHFGVERSQAQHNLGGVARGDGVDALAFLDERANARACAHAVVAHEFGSANFFENVGMHAAVRAPCGFRVFHVCRASALTLGFHAALKALHVDLHAAIGAHFLGNLNGETVGVVQGKRLLAGKRIALEFLERLSQIHLALAKGRAEALLFGKNDAANELAVIDDFGVHVAHKLHDFIDVLVEERALDAHRVRLLDGAAQQTAQHVAAALVGGKNAVGNHEGDRAAVVRDDAQRLVDGGVGFVFLAGKALAHSNQAAQHVGVVVVRDALHNGRNALQAHTGIDVLRRQRGKRAVFLAVELGEHAVPVFKEAIAIATRRAVGAAATDFGALVKVNLGARAARAGGAGAPEVVVFAQARDMAVFDAEVLPNLDGLVVVFEHREVQLFFRQAEHFSREFVRPSAHLVLEVFAKAEIAQHFEERKVARIANIVDVVGAHALLHRRGADVLGVEFFLMQEVRLELHHASAREQKARIVGNQRRRRHALAALLLEELQVLLANFRCSHVLHWTGLALIFRTSGPKARSFPTGP